MRIFTEHAGALITTVHQISVGPTGSQSETYTVTPLNGTAVVGPLAG